MGVRTPPEPKLDPKATHSQSSRGASEGGGRSPTASFSFYFFFLLGRGQIYGLKQYFSIGYILRMYVCVPFFVACENFAGRQLVVAAQRLLPSQGGHAHQQWDFSMIRVFRYVFV